MAGRFRRVEPLVVAQHAAEPLSAYPAWFAIVDGEWPALRAELERWMWPDNFDPRGEQRTRLACSTSGNRQQ
jgi:hypothetical protein